MPQTQNQFPVPTIYNYQSPAVGNTRGSSQGTTDATGNTRGSTSYNIQTTVQSPSIGTGNTRGTTAYPYRSPARYSFDVQNTVQGNTRGNTEAQGNTRGSTEYNIQTAVPYIFQSPFTYPFSVNNRGTTQIPTIGNTNAVGITQVPGTTVGNTRGNTQQPFTYQVQNTKTGQTRTPFTYPYRSPSIVVNQNVTQPYPYIANRQTTVRYSFQYSYDYTYQSPSITQVTTNGTRPIGQVAEVKGVFFKDSDGVVKKTQEVYFKKDSSTVEKTHQTIPISQMNR
tara:strand:- start:19748 stop:20590 length:843 start_codon:yes stop_codon:yes gene_type:complete